MDRRDTTNESGSDRGRRRKCDRKTEKRSRKRKKRGPSSDDIFVPQQETRFDGNGDLIRVHQEDEAKISRSKCDRETGRRSSGRFDLIQSPDVYFASDEDASIDANFLENIVKGKYHFSTSTI